MCVSHPPSKRGFTLIEVLVALVLVSVLVAGAMGLLAKAAAVIGLARVSTTAALLAMQKVEQLRAAPAVMASGTQQDYFAADSSVSPAASAFFVRRWTVTPGWAATGASSVVVEVLAVGSGRVAEVQAVVGGLP
ncbi:MAG: prepilin-type N-terminal cleavage/methylation domain-containing protein [Acidobacteria bacterium]|nr:prepilin-type N-terminal cleavage/methylation domain-containing protein [Acidobacteriota bacterium]